MKTLLSFVVLLALFAGVKTYAQSRFEPDHPVCNGRTDGACEWKPPPVTIVPIRHKYMILPPEQYDHFYEGDLTIKIVDTLKELWALCDIKRDDMLACSLPTAKSCVVIMVRDEVMRKKGWTTGILLRHEIGHCNGWSWDNQHAGMRALTGETPSGNTHWVGEWERVKIPADRLKRAEQIRTGGPK